MKPNQPPWPRYWLMTDERIGDRLWQAIAALPRGQAGIAFRHYSLGDAERLELGRKVAEVARQRELLLAIARGRSLAEQLGAALLHNPADYESKPFSRSVHNEREAETARQDGAALAFVSPVHSTRSHPEAAVLGIERAVKLARLAACPAIALGGMDRARFEALDAAFPGAFHGYAGIDCWLSN